ncbi:MAG: preprotein translocase subunit YajC [Syntrophomonadaceae bacterium]|jgi:preprotein translocase subunit YajC|nr:preprotein translocase subunit YajC [Syntrophomonadaceae bacterium]
MEWQLLAIYMLGFFVIFYVLLVLPRKRQEKKHNEMVESLTAREKVVTIGGICGEIKKVKEKTFMIITADGTNLEILKTAVAYKEEE